MANVQEKAETVVSLAADSGKFKTLVKALNAADLVETLSGKGPFTVFAPSEKAFQSVPAETMESLLKPKNKSKLQKLLKHHVVSGRKMAKSVGSASSMQMLDRTTLKITKKGDKVRIGGATITTPDLEADNGVIHVIDQVIMPE